MKTRIQKEYDLKWEMNHMWKDYKPFFPVEKKKTKEEIFFEDFPEPDKELINKYMEAERWRIDYNKRNPDKRKKIMLGDYRREKGRYDK